MASPPAKKKDLASFLKNLTIEPSAPPSNPTPSNKKVKSAPVADNWEDEADDDDDNVADTPTAVSQTPSAPPPTPISPFLPPTNRARLQSEGAFVSTLGESSSTSASTTPSSRRKPTPTLAPARNVTPPAGPNWKDIDRIGGGGGGGVVEERKSGDDKPRPEKTDAVAKRMIAGALGIKAPKKTEDQKKYEAAVREAERTRREREKEEAKRRVEELERAKKAIWDD